MSAAAYTVRLRDAHAYSLTGRSFACFVGEIVRIDTGKVAYSSKFYEEKRTARLQAARYLKRYEHHLVKHGIGFEEQEAQRKAAERAARDAKRAADRLVRDAAHDLLAALLPLVNASPVDGGMIRFDGDELQAARAAIAKATGS